MRDHLPHLGVALLGLAVLCTAWAALTTRPAPSSPPPPPPAPTRGSPANQLPAGSVAAVLGLDAAPGAASFARAGDHIDVFAFFPAEVAGGQPLSRLLLSDAVVLRADEKADSALTVAVKPSEALLLQQLEQLRARPFAVLHSARPTPSEPAVRDVLLDSDVRPWLTQAMEARAGRGGR